MFILSIFLFILAFLQLKNANDCTIELLTQRLDDPAKYDKWKESFSDKQILYICKGTYFITAVLLTICGIVIW